MTNEHTPCLIHVHFATLQTGLLQDLDLDQRHTGPHPSQKHHLAQAVLQLLVPSFTLTRPACHNAYP
ncbi:hypothetical protein Hamer_G023137 [Homarus americanus]|uniref:Uncharacterized protein n=1 Tax=Homarus americanus TaxID=6706 RepID=A0A8J5KC39_HOMAM|nr:hypothetical protein Hamer_G023137 [Homarus americanus]